VKFVRENQCLKINYLMKSHPSFPAVHNPYPDENRISTFAGKDFFMIPFSRRLIDFDSTHSFSSLVLDYLKSNKLQDFQSFIFNEEGFRKAIEYRQGPGSQVNRQLLSSLILEQYEKQPGGILISDKTKNNISALKKNTTFTVTTGHQLNLFTGPLYFIYKIISAINLSVELKKKFPAFDFVPVYWMASEDHDLKEINHIHLFGRKITWNPSSEGAAGRVKNEGLSEILHEVKGMLDNPNTENILSLFERAYDSKNNLSDAARIIVNELFSDHGLVILDADDARLKKNFVNEMKDDVINHTAFRMVEETIGELDKNYKAQVHPREINLFYLGENFRERIVEDQVCFRVLNKDIKFSREELLNEIENHPEKFSPNVVLRPLYQEKTLPNVAYVGGPAEISYWLEYKKMFSHYGAKLPVLVLRSCALILDSSATDKIKKLGLEPEDIFMSEDDIINKYLKLKLPEEFSIDPLLQQASEIFEEAVSKISLVDPTLKASAEAEKQKTINSLKSLEDRVRRAEKKKHEIAIGQIRKLKEKLFPEKKLQERHENILSFYARYGDGFLTELIKQLNPLEKKFVLLIGE
jgi:bacillithiol biosynthesis cysteine-adding enzyme BshC